VAFTAKKKETTMSSQNQTPTIIRRKQVEARTGLSRSTLYAKLRHNPKRPTDYDPTFPTQISLGAKAVGWIEEEIDDWLSAQIEKSRKGFTVTDASPRVDEASDAPTVQALPRKVKG
jgi:prophage regulatory protein